MLMNELQTQLSKTIKNDNSSEQYKIHMRQIQKKWTIPRFQGRDDMDCQMCAGIKDFREHERPIMGFIISSIISYFKSKSEAINLADLGCANLPYLDLMEEVQSIYGVDSSPVYIAYNQIQSDYSRERK